MARKLLSPLLPRAFGFDQARHLLNRAGFGGSLGQTSALEQMGLRKAVDFLLDFEPAEAGSPERPEVDPDIISPPTPAEQQQLQEARRRDDEIAVAKIRARRLTRMADDRRQMASLRRWWLRRMISTPQPLAEQLVLLWHSHFATNFRTVRDSYLMYKQNAFFRKHAAGNFADLAMGIIHDPAMIRFLDNHNNRKRSPNENLARELMELFTLGEGNYAERDIKEGARALTGYTFRDNQFLFARRVHDDGEKTILGKTGRFDGEDFVRLILRQKSCATFVCYKLYRHFVADLDEAVDEDARSVILQMARLLRASKYRMKPVLKKLFLSHHFYDPKIIGNKIVSPVQMIVGTIRALEAPVRDVGLLVDAVASMGQHLFDPPSVAGWEGGRSWINTSTLFVRQNVTTYIITGKLPFEDGWTKQVLSYDPMKLVAGISEPTAEQIVDHLMRLLPAGRVAGRRRPELVEFLRARGGPIDSDKVIALLLLMTSMPEYQLC